MGALRAVALLAVAIVFAANLLADEVRIKTEEVPQPVLNAVEKLAPAYTFGYGKRITEKDGKVSYQIGIRQWDKEFRFVTSPEGKLLETRGMNPKLADAPDPVKNLIEGASRGQPDAMVKITYPGRQPFYKFQITRTVTADGNVGGSRNLGNMVPVKNQDVPQPVRNMIGKLAPGSEWLALKITGNNAKYGPGYEVRVSNSKFFIVSPEGKLDETWDLNVKLADVPDPVRKAVERATAGGEREPENLIKITPTGGGPSYMFRIKRDVAEDGSILPKEKQD